MNKSAEVNAGSYGSVYALLFSLLYVSAFLGIHHRAIKKYTKQDNLNTTHQYCKLNYILLTECNLRGSYWY